ncbi:unnamed protein product [Cylindrotheca closterium]|uniref:Sulfotransferase n=1 Tax=Cylindrotheca closterium TaxID=2856 RepID=A0AAD2PW69_9STRA|nr:unnamed protein product [Cylindrotheca closterium]
MILRHGCSLLSITILLSVVAQFEKYIFPSANKSQYKKSVGNGVSSLTEKDMQCSQKELLRKTTFRCPSRGHELREHKNDIPRNISESEYRQNYIDNMIAVYDGIDKDLFQHCTSLSFPLETWDPPECWPVPVILPSYPTSGNGLFRSLLSNLTAPLETSMVMYNSSRQLPTALFRLGPDEGSSTLVHGMLTAGDALPLFRRIVVFKSHMGGKVNNPNMDLNAAKLHVARQHEKLHGILRLARNPGDQMLRNHFRWNSRRCYKEGLECFLEKAHRLCPAMPDVAEEYHNFHTFWSNFDSTMPQHVAYYENFSSKAQVKDSIVAAMQFLNTLTPDVDYERFYKDKDRMAMATGVIREPKYEHGKLLAEVCGVAIARRVHAKTKAVTKELGYVFDNADGTWSLDSTRIRK